MITSFSAIAAAATLSLSAGHAAHTSQLPIPGGACTPLVYVNGTPLETVDLSDHDSTATFYGRRTIVSFHMHGRRVVVSAFTFLPHAIVRAEVVKGEGASYQ